MRQILTVCGAVAVARELTPNPTTLESSVILFLDHNRYLLHSASYEGDARSVCHPSELYLPYARKKGVCFIYALHNHPANHANSLYPSKKDHRAAAWEKSIFPGRIQVYSVVWTPEGRHRLYDEREPHTAFSPEPCGCFNSLLPSPPKRIPPPQPHRFYKKGELKSYEPVGFLTPAWESHRFLRSERDSRSRWRRWYDRLTDALFKP